MAERRLRRTSAWLLLFFLLQGELGAIWDREWHAFVGRDQFWTPPHILIYSCVAGAGFVALAVVLLDTARYRRGTPGVNDISTVRILWLFHAPLGFTIAGFGALTALAAVPLDNYWHELYGIDIALWAPFHMMGVTGGVIGIIGIIYTFASEAALDRQARRSPRQFLEFSALELGALMTLAGLLNFTLTGFLQFPIVTIGPLRISTYPLPLAVCASFCLIAAVRLTLRPGAATLVVLLLLLHTLAAEIFIPWAIRTAVAQQGLVYRIPGHAPFFSLAAAFLALLFLVSALIVDGAVLWRLRHSGKPGSPMPGVWLIGAILTLPELMIAPFMLNSISKFAPVFLQQPGSMIPPALNLLAVLLTVLAVLLIGSIGAVLGADFGDIWHWSTR